MELKCKSITAVIVTIIIIITIIMEKIPEKKETYSVNSYAKINLFLDVVSKRKDNYHEIRTIFTEIDLHDDINFTLTKNNKISILTNIDSLSLYDNLIYKIAFFIQQKFSVKYGVNVELNKRIPLSAGLGGGSSNAAKTIEALSDLWKLSLTDTEKHEIAASFGSDINFFLMGNSALGEGRGEILKSVDPIELDNILLIKPDFGISSKEAYQAVKITQENQQWKDLLKTGNVKYSFNKLEEGILELYPTVKEIIDNCYHTGAVKSILSGSGSTVIGFYPSQGSVNSASAFFRGKGYWTTTTKTRRRTS